VTQYKEIRARAVGNTPQERIVEILEQAGIKIRIDAPEEAVLVVLYKGEYIIDEDACFIDMLPPDQVTNYE